MEFVEGFLACIKVVITAWEHPCSLSLALSTSRLSGGACLGLDGETDLGVGDPLQLVGGLEVGY